jgi:hypothetical protein
VNRRLLLPLPLLALAGCLPEPAPVKTIVGARLIDGTGRPPIEYSIVVIEGDRIKAAGPQTTVPVPKSGENINGLGMTLEPLPGNTIEPGQPADLVLKGSTERRMKSGQWQ